MAQPTQNFGQRLKQAFGEKFNFKTILALFVFGMIIIVFSFSSINGPQSGNLGSGVAATVDGEIISLKQFQDQENRVSQYYSQMLGGQFENLVQRKNLRNEALNQLVDNTVASLAAQKESILGTDANIKNAILEMPYFKKDGVFQSDLYKGVLASNGLQAGDFEKMMRQQISIQKVRDLFEASTLTTSSEKNIDSDLKNSKINLSYLKIDSDLASKLVTDQKIKESLQKADFKKKVDEYIKNNSSLFGTPEQVKASHILVKADMNNPQDVEKAQQKAQQILNELQKGDFAALAKKYSDDPGSKEKGGDLGFFGRGSMVKEFEETAFTLNKGQISKLVKTSFGFHIIKSTDKKAAQTKSVDESQIISGRKILSDETVLTLAKEIEQKISKGISVQDLNAFLNEKNYKLSDTGLFDISNENVPGINSSSVFKAALELTKSKPVGQKIVKDGETQYLVVLKDAQLSSNQINPETDSLSQTLNRQKAYSQYQIWLESQKKNYSINKNTELLAN